MRPGVAHPSTGEPFKLRRWWDTFKTVILQLGSTGPMVLLAAALPFVGGLTLLGVQHLIAPWMRGHVAWGVPLFVGAFSLLGGMALLPSYANSALAGWVYGPLPGTLIAMTAMTGAAAVGYLFGRRATHQRVAGVLAAHPRGQLIYDGLLNSGKLKALLIITLIRIPPVPPFAVTNLLMGSARVWFPGYLLGTFIGILPRTAMVVLAAASLKHFDLRQPHHYGFVLYYAASILLAAAAIGWMAHRTVSRLCRQ